MIYNITDYPALGTPGQIVLMNSIGDSTNVWTPDWHKYDVDNLTIRWQASNISSLPNTLVDICLYGYWEDVIDRDFAKVGLKRSNLTSQVQGQVTSQARPGSPLPGPAIE